MKTKWQKLSFKKIGTCVFFINILFISACSATINNNQQTFFHNLTPVKQLADSNVYPEGKEAVNPKEYEQAYLKLIQEQYHSDPKVQKALVEKIKKDYPDISDEEIKTLIDKEHNNKAIDYAHFQYLNERTMSLYISSVFPNGNLTRGHGTGWFVDRLKNEDGISWSNDFIISTNIHVINQLTPKEDDDEADDGIDGYAREVLDLSISKLPYDWNTINNKNHYLAPNSYQKIDGWNNKAFKSNNRLLLSRLENVNISNKLNYFLDFSGFDPKAVNNIWTFFYENYSRLRNAPIFARQQRFWEFLTQDRIKKFNLGEFLSRDVDPTFYHDEFFNLNFEANQNLDFTDFSNNIPVENIENEFQKRLAQQTHLDQAFIKLTIDNETLNNFFPIFANPEKYNEWTFPKISQQEKVPLPMNFYSDTFYANSSRTASYLLENSERFQIWHAGYPVEQTQPDKNLNYRSSGPTFKSGTNDVFEYLINLNHSSESKLYLDYTDCMVYSTYCQNDYVQPGGFTMKASNTNTGGGSSGSLALDKDYNAVGIYWGSQRLGQGVNYVSSGLYNPFKISSSSSQLTLFEPSGSESYRIRFRKNEQSDFLLRNYLNNLLRLQYQKVFNFSHYMENIRFYNNIDFTSEKSIDSEIRLLFFNIMNNRRINMRNVPVNPLNYTVNERVLLILKALKKITANLLNYQTNVDNITPPLLNFLVSHFESYPNFVNYKITPFFQRKLGEVNINKQLSEYLQNHATKSYVYNANNLS